MPQFMLDVKAMARPLIPPGKSSLSSSQGTRRKGRVGGGQHNDQNSSEMWGQPSALCPRPAWFVVGERGCDLPQQEGRGLGFLLIFRQVRKDSGETLAEPDRNPGRRTMQARGAVAGSTASEQQERQLWTSAKHKASGPDQDSPC